MKNEYEQKVCKEKDKADEEDRDEDSSQQELRP